MEIFIFLGFIIVYAIIAAKHNQLIIDNKDWHLTQWFRVALVGVFITLGSVAKIDMIDQYFNLLFVFITLYWIIFDASLNLFRGLDFFYVGKTSWIDKTLKHWSFVIKLPLLLFTIFIIAFYLK